MTRFRKVKVLLIVIILAFGTHYGWLLLQSESPGNNVARLSVEPSHETYFCPMHPTITSDKPGRCPICGMDLEKAVESHNHQEGAAQGDTQREILYYRHPMGKNVTSAVPAKDEMGMDYIPVYRDESKSGALETSIEGRVPFSISQDTQQLIGVTKSKVLREHLFHDIRATGRVAYDPEIYGAIEEYRIALSAASASSVLSSTRTRGEPDSLVSAARIKLRLQGLTDSQIDALAKGAIDPEEFLLPKGKAWIYAEVFEYELPLIREQQSIQATIPSAPQEIFKGKITSINPIVDPASRTLRVKAEILDSKGLLRPDMFLNVSITSDLGEQLTVPDSAVVHTGSKELIFVVNPDGQFEPREVTLGVKSGGHYAIQSGLIEGETIVTSANFLIDSESRLRGIVPRGSHSQEGAGGGES